MRINDDREENISLAIYNSRGEKVFNSKAVAGDNIISSDFMLAGMYIVAVYFWDGTLISRKTVKQ